MFKKLLGSLSKESSAVSAADLKYTLPESMPNLNPDLGGVLPKIKLPDSVKKHMTDPMLASSDAADLADPDLGKLATEVGTDVATEAASEAITGEPPAGQILAAAAEDADGDSSTFLASLLSDPRFAIIGVNFLALGLKKETAILWAVESASLGYSIANEKYPDKPIEMSPEEEMAVAQAKAYAAGEDLPAEELSELAAEAGFEKPGALAAQAAAWDKQPPPPEAGDPDVLIGDMVAGAVLLAAAMTIPEPDEPQLPDGAELSMVPPDTPPESAEIVPEDPKEAMPTAKRMKPFIDKGIELAAAG